MMTSERSSQIPAEAYATVTSATPVYEMQQQTAAPSGPAPERRAADVSDTIILRLAPPRTSPGR
jgi:hypothetical protein